MRSHFNPLKRLFIDPELTAHCRQDLRLHVGRFVSLSRSRTQHIRFARINDLASEQLEVEGLSKLVHHQAIASPVLLVFRDSSLPLLGCFRPAFGYHLLQFPFFFRVFFRR